MVEMTVTNHSAYDLDLPGEPSCLLLFDITDSVGTQSVGWPVMRRSICSPGLSGVLLRSGETYRETGRWDGSVRGENDILPNGAYRLRFEPCAEYRTSLSSLWVCAPPTLATVRIAAS